MQSEKLIPWLIITCLLMGVGVAWLYVRQRINHCAYVPLLAEELLPNADMTTQSATSPLPQGWQAAAPGVQVGDFAVDGDGRALQLMGIANYIQAPPVQVQADQGYCFTGRAITDSHQGSTSWLQVAFRWLDANGQLIAEDRAPWQRAVLWQSDNPPEHWSTIDAAFVAPPGAVTLLVRVHPSSDDRLYLDAMHVRHVGTIPTPEEYGELKVAVHPWPAGYRAALSFSFDWETAMGGLIHSRSVGDPNFDQDPVLRGLRMRQGITSTLDLFRPHGIRATYYATGYNFLLSNTHKLEFMGNPTYQWASTENRWLSDQWQTMPWFAPDPYGTVQSHPAWYFGDLVPLLQREGQDIQSHTFSHFYGGFVGPHDWRADIAAWTEQATRRGVPPYRSLAFPWSSSGGMSHANWDVLVGAGVTSVTRLSDQAQYNLFPQDERGLVQQPHCRPLPFHTQILACPDFYLTPARADLAIEQIDRALETGGMIDLWAHTEEVVTAEQRAAWEAVVHYAAAQPDLWIAPLSEIANWQQARSTVKIQQVSAGSVQTASEKQPMVFTVTNGSGQDIADLALELPFAVARVAVDGQALDRALTVPHSQFLLLDIPARQTLEVEAWPTT